LLTNSCPTSMSPHPSGGQGRLCSMSQIPERSGLPSGVRGAGAVGLGLPSASRGTSAVGYLSHCAESVTDPAHSIAATPVTSFIVTSSWRNCNTDREAIGDSGLGIRDWLDHDCHAAETDPS